MRLIALFVQTCILLVLTPFIIEHLGTRLYGLWQLGATLSGYFLLMDLGLSSTVTRYVATAVGKKNRALQRKYFTNALLLFLFFAGIVIPIASVACLIMRSLMQVDLRNLAMGLTAIVALDVALSLPPRAFTGFLAAHMEFKCISVANIVKILLRGLLTIFVLQAGYSIIGLAISNLAVNVCVNGIIGIFIFLKYNFLRIDKSDISWTVIKELFSFAKYIFIGRIGGVLRFQLTPFFLALFIGLEAVAIYSISTRLVMLYNQVVNQIVGVMNPLFAQHYGANDTGSMRRDFLLGLRVSIPLAVFGGFGLIVYGDWFIQIWLGPDFNAAYWPLVILTIGMVFASSQSVGIGVLQGISRHKFFAVSNSLEAVMNVILTVMLINNYGMIGAAFGMAIPMTLVKMIVQPYVICRALDLDFRLYRDRTLVPFAKVLGVCLLLALPVRLFLLQGSLNLLVVLSGVVNIFLYTLFVFTAIFQLEERRFCYRLLPLSGKFVFRRREG